MGLTKEDLTQMRGVVDEAIAGHPRLGAIEGRLSTRIDVMNARFDRVDARLEGMDARFNGVDARLEAVDVRFDGMDARFDGMDARFDSMEVKIDESAREVVADVTAVIRGSLNMIGESFENVERRLNKPRKSRP